MVIWIIGLSDAGKTTIGRLLYEHLKAAHQNTLFLDGDILRDVWGDKLGHDLAGRALNAHRISNLCKVLDGQGMHIVACVLSVFPEWQKWNRDNLSSYFEVFLDVDMAILQDRDSKGIYGAAQRGEMKDVVGIDIPFPRPPYSDLVISGDDAVQQPDIILENILNSLPPLTPN